MGPSIQRRSGPGRICIPCSTKARTMPAVGPGGRGHSRWGTVPDARVDGGGPIMKRVSFALLVFVLLTFAPTTIASHTPTSRFVGSWTAIDCPSVGGAAPDCSVPWFGDVYGDASLMTLQIGRGLTP